jgi:hypothetical protein
VDYARKLVALIFSLRHFRKKIIKILSYHFLQVIELKATVIANKRHDYSLLSLAMTQRKVLIAFIQYFTYLF